VVTGAVPPPPPPLARGCPDAGEREGKAAEERHSRPGFQPLTPRGPVDWSHRLSIVWSVPASSGKMNSTALTEQKLKQQQYEDQSKLEILKSTEKKQRSQQQRPKTATTTTKLLVRTANKYYDRKDEWKKRLL
ncbi:hypothetical protein CRUP_005552, partial [Coryphaenoides rupestris]